MKSIKASFMNSFALVLVVLLCFYFSCILPEGVSTKTCTIFTITNDDITLFGNNEDHYTPNPVIGFYPAGETGHGSVHVGFRDSNGTVLYQGAVNDQGLAWDVNGLPFARLNPHPEKPFSYEADNFLGRILRKATTVEEAIQISKDFNFGDSMCVQIHIADASGDAVVISAGSDREIAYTRKPPGNGYLVSTNFNLANPENGDKSWRYEKAAVLLAELLKSKNITMEKAGQVLSEVHLEDLISYTMYSNVIDLKNGTIALNFMSQRNETIYLDITKELEKGVRIIEMRDMFSKETVEAGDLAYRQLEKRSTLENIGGILIILVIIGTFLITVKRIRKSRNVNKMK